MMPTIQYDEAAHIANPTTINEIPENIDPALLAPAEKLVKRYHEIVTILQEEPVEADSGRPSFSNHLAEDASDASEWQSRAAMSHHMVAELQQVERAMYLMRTNRYGQCEQCGRAIPPRRLSILPSATLCVACQEHADQRGMGH
jgi:RNA polymerase-binding transcription factor DksA